MTIRCSLAVAVGLQRLHLHSTHWLGQQEDEPADVLVALARLHVCQTLSANWLEVALETQEAKATFFSRTTGTCAAENRDC